MGQVIFPPKTYPNSQMDINCKKGQIVSHFSPKSPPDFSVEGFLGFYLLFIVFDDVSKNSIV
jgi:hypothetical protein